MANWFDGVEANELPTNSFDKVFQAGIEALEARVAQRANGKVKDALAKANNEGLNKGDDGFRNASDFTGKEVGVWVKASDDNAAQFKTWQVEEMTALRAAAMAGEIDKALNERGTSAPITEQDILNKAAERMLAMLFAQSGVKFPVQGRNSKQINETWIAKFLNNTPTEKAPHGLMTANERPFAKVLKAVREEMTGDNTKSLDSVL